MQTLTDETLQAIEEHDVLEETERDLIIRLLKREIRRERRETGEKARVRT